LCFVIATKKRNKLQLSRFISRSTGRNINQHLAARQSERERERKKMKKTKTLVVLWFFQVRYFYLSPSIVLKNKINFWAAVLDITSG
jgi:hypothetical protein